MTSSMNSSSGGEDTTVLLRQSLQTTGAQVPPVIRIEGISLVELALAYDLVTYFSPIILVTGTVLNVATILTVTLGKVGNISTRILLVNLAVCDLAYLHIALLDFWLRLSYNIFIRDAAVFLCKGHYFLTYVTRHCSSWGVLLLTVERFICVRFPLRARSICTKKWTCTLLIIIFIFLCILSSHILIFFDLDAGSKGRCDYGVSYAVFFFGPWFYIDITVYVLIPFSVITFCNVLITMKIFGRIKKTPELLSNVDTTHDTEVKRISIMLLVVSIVFMVLTLPQLLHFFVFALFVDYEVATIKTLIRVFLSFNATSLLSYSNSSINFILYCLSGSQFRNAFIQMVKGWFC
jgi:hypothetical protein